MSGIVHGFNNADLVSLRAELAEHDRDVPCDVTYRTGSANVLARLLGFGTEEEPCPNRADWLIVLDHVCPGNVRNAYICDEHRELFMTAGLTCTVCHQDQTPVLLERLR